MILYNPRLDLLGILHQNLVQISCEKVFYVYNNEWVQIGDI